jgi:hypothetical protein
MRIATCNIRSGGSSKRTPDIWNALLPLQADTLVFTEFRSNSAGEYLLGQLSANGYSRLAYTIAQNGVLVASRESFEFADNPAKLNKDASGLLRAEFATLQGRVIAATESNTNRYGQHRKIIVAPLS